MTILADYTAGTISVSANGTVVTGVGTAWKTAGFRDGDWFIANGWVNVVASIDSETQLTLAQQWQGGALDDEPYRLRYMSDGSRTSAQARQLIDMLGGSGNIEALGGLAGLADKIPYFTGPGTMALMDRGSVGGGLVPRGSWDNGTTYDQRDLVESGGHAYASIIDDNTGNATPTTETSNAFWMYIPVAPGPDGDTGWSPVLSSMNDGERRVFRVVDWVGGTGAKPVTGQFIGPSGLVSAIGDALDVRGPIGQPNSLAVGTVQGGATAGATITGAAPSQTLNLTLPKGDTGDDGWTPVFAVVADGARFVQQVIDWTGGQGTKPATGQYVGATGFEANIANAVNIRGASGSGSGDMQSATYDPSNVAGNAFSMGNMTETSTAKVLTDSERSAISANTSARHTHSNKAVLDGTTASFLTAEKNKLAGITAGATANTGTVTSVAMSVPTGLSVTGAVTTSGTFTVSYASGYQGYTTAEANKLNGIEAGAQVNLPVGTTSGTVAAGNDSRLSDAREWTAEIVSQVEAEEGTATTARKWTAQRVRQNASAVDIGTGQTWQDVSASRTSGTVYQNTTGKPIEVLASVTSTSAGVAAVEIHAGSTAGNLLFLAQQNSALGDDGALSIIVPPNGYYKVVFSGDVDGAYVMELR